MKNIQVLHIGEFEQEKSYPYFYIDTFRRHSDNFHKTITIPHKHNFFVVVLFTQGRGTHEIDFNSYEIKPGSVFLMYPGQVHHWQFTEDTDGYVLFHTQEFYEMHYINRPVNNFPFYFSTQNPPYLLLNTAETSEMTRYFEEILSEYREENLRKMQRIVSLLDLLYIDLSRLYLQSGAEKTAVPVAYTRKIRQLEKLIERHYTTEKLASAYAEMMHVSPKHLNRMVKTSLQKTTSDLIIERVMLEAKRLLVHSPNAFSDIARQLGYEDYAYFSRLFKQKTGLTPSEFVKKYK
ncbi:AraC family transcriptional regulator [Sinomicrobium weinanense]|uniref:Helix-turn-helix domain-containing protein n=1 Tax=Sinomicrobium weinanense TaxID=2842200 RepID=A0A926Q1B6_9FLAO|nr:AraC family transcriptional regulator [Sinomicrobium weinanense]MBC9795503.1 helix-turn-helix domain-containing protein [Sinomicrobium weinanense]MBU3123350.1 AraC family transcriptional regulator [Sinomicrobium weinanense]